MKRLAPLLVGLAFGCEKPATTPPVPTPPPSGLRVPLPEGWRGVASTDGLSVGPEGKVVLQLERTQRPFPSPDALSSAVTAEGVEVLEKESNETFSGVRYSIAVEGLKREAFLGVRSAGDHTIWCSTTMQATRDDVEAAMTVCKGVSQESE
ncbi:MAG TPA: hypothetical protein VGE37_01160 [Archangium sp.]